MSVINRVKLNRLIDTVSGLPLVHGDYYRPADRIIDMIHAEGFTGDLLSEVLTHPSILTGLTLTVNPSFISVDITAGVAVGVDSQSISIIEHNYDGVPLTGFDATTGYTHPVNVNSGLSTVPRFIVLTTALTNQSTASVPNSGTGFVKLRYKDQNTFTRNTPSDPTATAYSFLTRDSYELIIDTIAPTVADVCLGEFTKDAFGAITSLTFVSRELATGIQLKNGFLDLPAGFRLKFDDSAMTSDRVFSLPNRDMTIAATDESITAIGIIAANTLVTIVGDDSANTRPQVSTISNPTQLPFGYATAAIANNASGTVIKQGRVTTTLNTTTSVIGAPVFATAAGGLTLVYGKHRVGTVESLAVNGVIFFDLTREINDINTVAVTAGANITAETVVRIIGDDATNLRPTVQSVSATTQTPFGYASSAISNGVGGLVTTFGRVVTTLNAATATVGNPVYTNGTGALTLVKTDYRIGTVVTATANATVFFDFTNITPESSLIPTGSLIAGAFAAVPAGFLLCNGASLSTTTFASLFAVIGYTYGGAGANFNIPDTQGAFLRSAGTSTGYTQNVTITLGTITNDAFQGHWHSGFIRPTAFNGNYSSPNNALPSPGDFNVGGLASNYVFDPINDGTNGTPRTANETRVKSVAVNYFIKF